RTITECIPPTAWSAKLPDVHLPGGGKTYGHEYEVLISMSWALSRFPIAWDVQEHSWLTHWESSQVMLGSGSSNVATRDIIGLPEKPLFRPGLRTPAITLPYSIGMGIGSRRRMQYGELIERPALAIQNQAGRILAQSEQSD